MNLAVLGGFGKKPFAPGWKKETAAAVLGGGEIDLTSSPPAPDGGHLTAVALLGGIDVRVPPGSRVSMSGLSFLGGREVTVEPNGGPEIAIRGIAILGGIEVKSVPRSGA
jgi:hypothetical protein